MKTTVDLPMIDDDSVPKSSNRSFGIVFFIFFTIVSLFPLISGKGINQWALWIAIGFLAVAIIYPKLLAPLNYIWFRFGLLLHKIVSPVVLGLVYFIAIVPIGLFMRLLGKDILGLRLEDSKKSYWITRENIRSIKQSLKNQF